MARSGWTSGWAVAVSLVGAAIAIVPESTAAQVDEPEPITESLTESLGRGVEIATSTFIADSFCLPDTTPESLNRLFDGEPGGVIGADYQRTLQLPDGNVLWTFQDAKFELPDGEFRIIHNMGMMQVDNCFSLLLSGTRSDPRSWMFGADTAPLFRWFWPLDAEMGVDGRAYIFAAEMNERGEHYLDITEPSGTFVAAFDPDTWNIVWQGRATNDSAALYGWSMESDDQWTYLFAQCHRQFGYDPMFGVFAHDRSCTDKVTVGRVPLGEIFASPTYWNGSTWQSDPSRARPIIERSGRFANPTQFIRRNNKWVAITKVDDWWSSRIVIEQALRASGPYAEIERLTATPKCDAACNTYFASWAEGQGDDDPDAPLTVALSNNRWDGIATSVYRPTFFTVASPPDVPASAARCDLGHCD